MNKVGSLVGLLAVTMMAFACGGRVDVGSDGTVNTGGGGAGGSTASGSPEACPGVAMDTQIMALVGQPCAGEGAPCDSDSSGCGGCYVTCKDGVWEPESSQLCTYIQDC